MIVYELGPIDMWFGWTPLQKVLAIASKPFSERVDWCHHSADKLEYALAHAQQLAKLLGWERDMREGPYFSPLPGERHRPSCIPARLEAEQQWHDLCRLALSAALARQELRRLGQRRKRHLSEPI